jgi:hypothetical protein
MTTKVPFMTPEEPIPAIALPTMSMADEFAAPHTREPISNSKKKAKYAHYSPPFLAAS